MRKTLTEIETPVGTARATVEGTGSALAVLGHGAGGGIEAGDLRAMTAALLERGWRVARVEQPYRVSGRRAPDRAPKLDDAWTAVVKNLRGKRKGPLLLSGRSSGARVACRTAVGLGASAVVCLAFPLHPPGRPESSRAEELELVGDIPLLVVQGERDAFGTPAEFPPSVHVVPVDGDHLLRRTTPVAAAVVEWLDRQRLT